VIWGISTKLAVDRAIWQIIRALGNFIKGYAQQVDEVNLPCASHFHWHGFHISWRKDK
jgi:hypothetical protein